MTPPAAPVSAIILTFNEEKNIEACLASLSGWVGEIIIVDSHSTDQTCAIAARYGARIYQHDYEGAPKQWHWALANTELRHPWLLTLDADFRITHELRASIQAVVQDSSPTVVDAYLFRRLQVFRGKPLRHGGLYSRKEIRLIRHDRCTVNANEGVDQVFYVPGKVGELRGDLIEENFKEDDISFWIQKHDHFSSWQSKQELEQRLWGNKPLYQPSLLGSPIQRKLWLKERWYRLPLYWRPLFYFLYRYFLRLGFLDGKQGFIYHFLQAYWYRLIVDIKLEELLSGDKPPLVKNDLI